MYKKDSCNQSDQMNIVNKNKQYISHKNMLKVKKYFKTEKFRNDA